MSPQITPESLRSHADFVENLTGGPGAAAIAHAMRREANQREDNAYVLTLAKVYRDSLADSNTGHHRWADISPGLQVTELDAMRAVLEHLEADGRLRPPVVDSEVDESAGEWATWEDVPEGVRVTAPGVGRGETFEKVESGSAVHRFESGNVCCAQFDAPAFGPFVPAEGVAA